MLRRARRIVEEFDGGTKVRRALRSIESVSLTVAGTGTDSYRLRTTRTGTPK